MNKFAILRTYFLYDGHPEKGAIHGGELPVLRMEFRRADGNFGILKCKKNS